MAELPRFEERLRSLISNNPAFEEFLKKSKYGKPSVVAFADFVGTSRQSLGYYLNGERIPDALMVKQICERCNVSADWLLGLCDVKRPNANIQAVCKYTGLSEKAVSYLHHLNGTDLYLRSYIETTNLLLGQIDESKHLLELLNSYLIMDFSDGQILDKNEFIPMRSIFGFHTHDDNEIVFAIGGQDVFKNALLDRIRDSLKQLRSIMEGNHDGKPTESR